MNPAQRLPGSPAARVFVLALAIRLLAMLVLHPWQFDPANHHWAAGWETGRIAMNLAEGHGFALDLRTHEPTGWLAPAYPALLAVLFAVFGTFSTPALAVILCLQVALSALTAAALVRLGQRLGTPRVGAVAGLCFACSPAAVNTSVRVLWSTSLITLLVVELASACLLVAQEPTRRNAALLGCLGGFALLVCPVAATCIGAGALWLCSRRRYAAAAVVLATSVVIASPWIVRNRIALGSWSLVKSNFGNELFIGNHEGATGRYTQVLPVAERLLAPADYARLEAMPEAERVATLGAHARRWIADHPGDFARLTATRIANYWTLPLLTSWDTILPARLGPFAAGVNAVVDHLLLLLMVAGMLAGPKRDVRFWIPVSFVLAYPVAYYVTHSDITRYRFPVTPFVWLLALRGAATAAALVRAPTARTK